MLAISLTRYETLSISTRYHGARLYGFVSNTVKTFIFIVVCLVVSLLPFVLWMCLGWLFNLMMEVWFGVLF